MKQLFLASAFNRVSDLFVERLERKPETCTILFIANAADLANDPWWVALDKTAFTTHGFKILETDLRTITAEELQTRLEQTDIIHVCGGSVLYLTKLIHEKHFDKLLYNAVAHNNKIYTGTSAGSMIVAPNVTLSQYEEEEEANAKAMGDFTGLSLVPFYIIPHGQNDMFIKSNQLVMEHLPENTTPIIILNDHQAVWVVDDKIEMLSAEALQ